MTEYEFHPLANLFPLMEGEDFAQLVEDIRVNGLRNAIMLHEGKILDGRNRYRACLEAGVEPATMPWKEEWTHHGTGGALGYVLSANLHRRHLTTDQRGAIAAELATMKVGRPPQIPSNDGISQPQGEPSAPLPKMTTAEAATAMKVGTATVERAKHRMREDPEAHAQAKAGALQRAVATKRRVNEMRPRIDRFCRFYRTLSDRERNWAARWIIERELEYTSPGTIKATNLEKMLKALTFAKPEMADVTGRIEDVADYALTILPDAKPAGEGAGDRKDER
jgi:hypothetical protein